VDENVILWSTLTDSIFGNNSPTGVTVKMGLPLLVNKFSPLILKESKAGNEIDLNARGNRKVVFLNTTLDPVPEIWSLGPF
jgi:hypothetical protein